MLNKAKGNSRISTSYLNKVADAINAPPEIPVPQTVAPQTAFIAAITSTVAGRPGWYNWREVHWNTAANDWEYTGRRGNNEIDSYAVEKDMKTYVPEDAIVIMVPCAQYSNVYTFEYQQPLLLVRYFKPQADSRLMPADVLLSAATTDDWVAGENSITNCHEQTTRAGVADLNTTDKTVLFGLDDYLQLRPNLTTSSIIACGVDVEGSIVAIRFHEDAYPAD